MITWTKELDRVIVSGVASGLSGSQIATKLGAKFTRSMVIARHKRIRGIISPCEHTRNERSSEERIEAQRERAKRVAGGRREIDRQLRAGLRRDFVIANAQRAGLTLREIGAHFGFSYEWVRQICLREGVHPARAA